MSAHSIPADRYATRLARAQRALPGEDASALLVGVGPDLEWLLGYSALPLSRLTILVLPAEGRGTLVVPRLEAAAAQNAPGVSAGLVDLTTWNETDDPFALVASLLAASKSRPEIQLGALGGTWGRLGTLLVSDRLWARFLLSLQGVLPDAAFAAASSVLGPLRAVKDEAEIELLRRAAAAADRVVTAVASGPLVGRSERNVAREVRDRLVDEGHDEPSFAIVGSGPNSASPHHEASDRLIRRGEPVVLDIGGRLGGYGSDTTRTLWVSGDDGAAPETEFVALYETLQQAQAEATRAVRPGVPAEQVDAVARMIISDAGYGQHFIHRTGHGIGLEGHEDPYLVAGNGQPLEVGHSFSVEPGIYLEGRYGARIEDIVVCTSEGPDVLNATPRELLVVSG